MVRPHPNKGPYVRKRPPIGKRRWVRASRRPNWVPPNYKLRIQTLGSGTTSRWIENEYDVATNTLGQVSFASLLNNSTEYANLAIHYRYMKVLKIIINVPPISSNGTFKTLLRWTDDIGAQNIDTDDSVKRVNLHSVRYQRVKYRPANLQLANTGVVGLPVVNLKDWITIDDLINASGRGNIPGNILVKHTAGETIRIRACLQIAFRSSKLPDSKSLKALQEKIEEKEKKNEAPVDLIPIS